MSTEVQNLIVNGALLSATVPGANAQYRDMSGRFKTSNDVTIFHSSEIYQKNALKWDEIITAGTITGPANGAITLSVTGAGRLVRQSKKYCTAVPGRTQSFYIGATLHNATPATGAKFRVGSYDTAADKTSAAPDNAESNGHFFEMDNTSGTPVYYAVQRTSATGSVVETRVVQTSWNLDKLVDVNWTLPQTVIIERTQVGAGATRLGLLVSGVAVWAHSFEGRLARATLPIRYELDATTVVSGTSTLQQHASNCSVENFDIVPQKRSQNVVNRSLAAATPMIILRGIAATPRVTLTVKKITAATIATGAATIVTALIYVNPTVTGASYATNSNAEYSTVGSVTGGTLMASVVLSSMPVALELHQELANTIAGVTADTIAVVFNTSGTAGGVGAVTIDWDELF